MHKKQSRLKLRAQKTEAGERNGANASILGQPEDLRLVALQRACAGMLRTDWSQPLRALAACGESQVLKGHDFSRAANA